MNGLHHPKARSSPPPSPTTGPNNRLLDDLDRNASAGRIPADKPAGIVKSAFASTDVPSAARLALQEGGCHGEA